MSFSKNIAALQSQLVTLIAQKADLSANIDVLHIDIHCKYFDHFIANHAYDVLPQWLAFIDQIDHAGIVSKLRPMIKASFVTVAGNTKKTIESIKLRAFSLEQFKERITMIIVPTVEEKKPLVSEFYDFMASLSAKKIDTQQRIDAMKIASNTLLQVSGNDMDMVLAVLNEQLTKNEKALNKLIVQSQACTYIDSLIKKESGNLPNNAVFDMSDKIISKYNLLELV